MSSRWRQRLRRLRFWLGGLAAAGLIAVAVLIGLAQVLLPLAAHYPGRVADFLGQRLQQPVHFASMDGHWQASGPLLILHDVSIGGRHGEAPLRLPVADVKLDFGALLLPGRRLVNLRLVDLHLDLTHGVDGTWSVAGIGAAGGKTSQHLDLGQLPGGLWLDHLRVNIHDARSGHAWSLWSRTLRVSNNGSVLRFAGDLRRPGVVQACNVSGRMSLDRESGTVYVGGRKLDLGRLLAGVDAGGYRVESGHGSLQLWFKWEHARMVAQTARADLTGLDMRGPAGRTHMAHLEGLFGFRRDAGGWDVRLAMQNGAALMVRSQGKDTGRELWARARNLDLQGLLPVAAQIPGLPPALARWLLAARPQGMVPSAVLRWSAARGLEAVNADFRGLELAADGKRPGIGPLNGQLFGDAESMLLSLPTQAAVLQAPGTFRTAIDLQRLKGELVAWHGDGSWNIGTTGLDFAGKGFSGQVRGHVRLPDTGGKPFMDLYLATSRVSVQAAKQFWPVDAMPPHAVEWLDRALVSGYLAHGEALLRGDLADWPFRHHGGRFEARGEIDDATLAYNPHWPSAEGVHAIASFVDNSMLIRADKGHSRGNLAQSAVASVSDFHDSQLVLNVQGSGSGTSMLDFALHSPIAEKQAKVLDKLKLGGSGSFNFSLVLPLRHVRKFMLGGSLQVRGMDVDDVGWGLHLADLAGTMHFDGHGLSGSGLKARFNGVPSRLNLAFGPGATGGPNHPVSVSMQGHYDVATLVQGRPLLAPLKDIAHGNADFDIGFDIARAAGAKALRQTLTVDSSLEGIALSLPAPLNKPADTVLPLQLGLDLPVSGGALRVSLGSLVQARARLPVSGTAGTPLALAVRLGAKPPTALPESGVRILGHSRDLDVTGWLQRAMQRRAKQGKGGPQLNGVDVQIDRAKVFGAFFHNLHLMLTPQKGQISMRIDCPQVQGILTLPTRDLQRRGILARLKVLDWPDETASRLEAAKEREHNGPAPAASASVPVDYADTGVDPSAIPPLHVFVGKLRLGKARLGQARFESWPTAKGMHIDLLRTHTSSVQIMGSGDWNGTMHDSHTHMKIDFGAENLGSLLNALGYGGLIQGGRTQAHLDATWAGEPSSLAMQRMNGTLRIEVGKGRIPKVQPGMGRLFGLMALTELPRRLSLDFGDVFGKGLGFDSIKGTFRLADGYADTSDLKLKGPAADISIHGRTDLRDKTYDQRILVVPHVGNSLPVVGALTSGPIGAAVGLVVQGLLGHGINRAASARYSLTGSWDKPKITQISRTSQRLPLEDEIPAPAGSAPPPAASATVASPHSAPAAASTAGVPGSAASVPAPAASTGRH